MLAKKPWTMMVYLAADNNLFTFGVDSLRQMKAAAGKSVNILAEFDTGPMNKAKRYRFDGQPPIGSIKENEVDAFGPTNAADPNNLANFIEWGAKNYPAERYFVVIWGHGGGIDDDFPRQPDHSFVSRHPFLSLFKGTPDDNPKGTPDDNPKGTPDDNPKTVLNGPLARILEPTLHEIIDVLKIGDEALRMAAIDALTDGVRHALDDTVLSKVGHLSFNGDQKNCLKKLRDDLLDVLQNKSLVALRTGALKSLQLGVVDALQKGISDALQTDVVYKFQTAILSALKQGVPDSAIKQVRETAVRMILSFLENGILEVQRMGLLDVSGKRILPPEKSLAFVDHPQDFLTNAGLKKALDLASAKIGQRIDIFGMDSCNMAMVEIGYDLRDSVDFIVASQDGVPDASWPYDRIIAKLANDPDISPLGLARLTASTYVEAYEDYVNRAVVSEEQAELDQPVTLSVIDLERCKRTVPRIVELAQSLRNVLPSVQGMRAVVKARNLVSNFGSNQFIDLVQFCQLLTAAKGSGKAAWTEAAALDLSSPEITQLTEAASNLIGPLTNIVRQNNHSDEEKTCHGISIYFPLFDPQQEEHEKRLGDLYQKLDFAGATGWNKFITEFLNQQKLEMEASAETAKANRTESEPAPEEISAALEGIANASKNVVDKINAVAERSRSVFPSLNGTLNAAGRVASAVASEVTFIAATSKNGGGNGKNSHHAGLRPEKAIQGQ